MPDDRPLSSPMPPAPRALGEVALEQVRTILHALFHDTVALAGDQARLQNDALSSLAQLAAFANVQFMARLMLAKGIDEVAAWPIAVVEIQQRMIGMLAEAGENARTRADG